MREDPGNLAFSPASISTAMAMTWGGARGETASQMAKVLHLQGDQEAVHALFGQFVKTVNGEGQREYTLSVANRLYGEKTFNFQEAYLEITRERYGAPLEAIDFRGAADASRQKINSWVAGETNDRIQDLLPAPEVTSDTRLVLVNALYFNAPWVHQFRESATAPATFHRTGADDVEVPTMHVTKSFPYATSEGVRLITLPYRGRELGMTIVLPDDADGLGAIEQSLTAETVQGWFAAFDSVQNVDVALPQFRIAPPRSVSLRQFFLSRGMELAFDGAAADFTGIADPPDDADRLSISNVLHKAFVEVNENGTEAAAATAVVMTRMGGAGGGDPVDFHVDRPFLFFIHTLQSHTILFMGRVVDPSAAAPSAS